MKIYYLLKHFLKHREGSSSTGCFLAQQSIEKFLKGLCASRGLEPEKTHDLTKLADSLAKFYPGIKIFYDELTIFNRYYIESRYPGDYPELTWEDCQKSFEIANKIKDFVESAIV